jgi:hypothetical protein
MHVKRGVPEVKCFRDISPRFSRGDDVALRTWGAHTGRCLAALSASEFGHSTLALAHAPDDGALLTGSFDGAMCLWDTSALEERGISEA